MSLICNLKYLLVLFISFITACFANQEIDFKCTCTPSKLMEGEIIEVDINKSIFKNLLIEKPNKQFVYLQNQSIDSIWIDQKKFERQKNFKLNTQLLTDYIYHNKRRLKSRVFDRDGTYKIIFTNANSVEALEKELNYCTVWFEMWK